MPLRRSSWAVLAATAVAAAACAIVWIDVTRRSAVTVVPDAPRDDPAFAALVGHAELEGVVRRDGKGTSALVEVRLAWPRAERAVRRHAWGRLRPDDEVPRLVERLGSAPVAIARAGDDGRFVVRGLAPGMYAVRASTLDGGDVAHARAWVVADGETAWVDLTLLPSHERLRGRVVHADGRPWTGTVLVLRLAPPRREAVLEDGDVFPADAEGRFDASGLPTGEVRVCAVAGDGTQALGEPLRLPTKDPYVLTVESGRTVTEGRVVSSARGDPIVGAEIVGSVRWPTEHEPVDRTSTGADGTFRVLVPTEDAWIAVRAPGFVTTDLTLEEAEPTVEIRLARGATVHGRVRSRADGRIVPGARLTIATMGWQDSLEPRFHPETWSDEGGNYRFDGLPAREFVVLARGEKLVSSGYVALASGEDPATVTLRPGEDRVVDVEMLPATRVAGALTDAEGAAARRILVHAAPVRPGARRRGDERPSAIDFVDDRDIAVSATDGSFAFDSLVPGLAYDIRATSFGGSISTSAQRLDPGFGVDTRVGLRLPAVRWVDVAVLDAGTDAPIPGARAFVTVLADSGPSRADDPSPEGDPFADLRPSHTVDASGHARVAALGKGALRIGASARGYAESRGRSLVDVVEGGGGVLFATVKLARQPTPPSQQIAGRVILPDGTPASDVDVQLRFPVTGLRAEHGHAMTDATGAFTLDALGVGEHGLRAVVHRKGLFTGFEIVTDGTTSVVLKLVRGPGPLGVVARAVDPEGRVVPFAVGQYESTTGAHSGAYREGHVLFDLSHATKGVPSVGAVVIEQARDRDGVLLPVGPARLEGVHPGDDVVVSLPPERAIEGRVVDADGRGVADVRIRAEAIDTKGTDRPTYRRPLWLEAPDWTRTAENGAFRIGQLGSDRVWIVVRPPGAFVEPSPILGTPDDRSVVLRLVRAVRVTLTIVDANGRPVPQARVVVARFEDGHASDVIRDLYGYGSLGVAFDAGPDGVVHVEGLDAKSKYVLGVRGPESRTDLADFLDTSWSPEDATIRRSPGRSVTGVVRYANGAPVVGVMVLCRREIGLLDSIRSDDQGRFRFDGLRPGAVTLTAQRHSRNSEPIGEVAKKSVDAGTQDVVLVVK